MSTSSRRGARTAATGWARARGCPRWCSPRPRRSAWSWRSSTRRAAPADGDDLVGSALDKVVRALPERVGREATALREHASSARDRRSTSPDPALTSALVDAVAGRRTAVVAYRSESGNEWEAEVDPWAVVVRHGRWYLLCRSHRADAIRTYRLDRVRAVQQTDRSFSRARGTRPGGRAGGEPGHRLGVPHPRGVRRPARPRWRPGSGLPWDGSSPPGTAACSSAARATRRCTPASGWRTVPHDFRVEDGPELRAAVARLAARFAAAVPATSPT